MRAIFLTMMWLGAGAVPAIAQPVPVVPAVPLVPQQRLDGLMEKAAAGDARAQLELGLRYADGDGGVLPDYDQAQLWLGEAAAQNNPDARTALAGLNARHDRYMALRAAAEGGDVKAQYALATLPGGEKALWHQTDTHEWLRRSAEQGYAPAEVAMGDYYLDGYAHDVTRQPGPHGPNQADDGAANLPEAMSWYTRAAVQDEIGAEYQLSALYALDTPFRDLKRMEYWWQKAAYHAGGGFSDGSGDSLAKLCDYYKGQSVVLWLSVGARRVLTTNLHGQPAYAGLRVCYEHEIAMGRGGEALVGLGELYDKGLGIPANPKAAADLYLRAVNSPNGVGREPAAMARLGLLYARTGDADQAYVWLSLAKRLDLGWNWRPDERGLRTEAIRTLGDISAKLSADQRKPLDATANKWLRDHPAPVPVIEERLEVIP